MQIKDIRIRNFRTIEAEQSTQLPSGVTLVGPNSSGKTNVLKAIRILFTGYENEFDYRHHHDLTFGQKGRTSITATFTGDPGGVDADIYARLDELHRLLQTQRSSTDVNITVYFTESDTPVYALFPNVKRPKDKTENARYSVVQQALINRVLKSFQINYVPSAKSIPQLYEEFLTPFVRRVIAERLEPHRSSINEELAKIADSVNDQLKLAGLNQIAASFEIPDDRIERILTSFNFMLKDPANTPIYEKGMGIQAAAILAAFNWVTQQQSSNSMSVIWLLEEPEAYLHPELMASTEAMLDALAKSSLVVRTTHSLGFVPQDPVKIRGITLGQNGKTEIATYRNYADATARIRSSLGVRFSDYYNFDTYNVLVEGPTDREVLKWVLDLVPASSKGWEKLRKAQFLDYGGVSHLAGFLRASYHLIRAERVAVSVFDGDAAGDKARRDLQGYFGRVGVPFEAGRDFVVVRDRFAIEGLFPDDFIINLQQAHPRWVAEFGVDAVGTLMPFSIPDEHKAQALNFLQAQGLQDPSLKWASSFLAVCDALENALALNEARLAQ